MIIAYFLLLFPLSCVTIQLTVYDNEFRYKYGVELFRIPTNTVFKFNYYANTELNIILRLKNIPPIINYDVIYDYQPVTRDGKMLRPEVEKTWNSTSQADYIIKSFLPPRKKSFIRINLCTITGRCERKTIAEGTSEPSGISGLICMKIDPCVFVVDFTDEATDKEPVTLSTTKEPATKPIHVEQNSTDTAMPDGIPVPGETVETTSTATVRDTDTNYTTTIIVTTLAAIVLVIVAAFVARKHCHFKCNEPETQELPTRDLSDRFYLNLLFRRECQQEIEELEEHHYEEITEQ